MRKNQKPAGKAGLRKNRWLPGYNHGSKVGYPKTGSDYGLIDDLTYQYTGNQLQKVDDANNPACQNNGFSDNGSFTNNEYLYDLNGNMIQDLNKEISNIDYTFTNLPEKVVLSTIEEEDIIYFWYDAAGQKLRKQTRTDGAIVATTDYDGSFIYENGFLQYILTDEGRIVYDHFNDTYQYQYFLKDHLGNTRILFDENGTVLQDNSYYPFGMAIDALCHSENFTPDNNYLFNGKELQDDFGLEWYDYGARFYDPQIGRWHVVDPLSEMYLYQTPNAFCSNNPINRIDLTGMDDDWYRNNETGKIQWFPREGELGKTETIRGEEWTNIGSELLKFKGNNLTYFWQTKDDNGMLHLNRESYNAVAGKPVEGEKSLTFDYSKKSQNTEGGGALPEGLYYIEKSKVQYYIDQSSWDKYKNIFGGGDFPGGTYSWGENRWWLKPLTANAENRNMYSFTIHGGDAWGSHGCIDLTHNLGTFTSTFLHVANSENVVLWVDYSKISTFTIMKGQWGW